jgi:hypothetical protein
MKVEIEIFTLAEQEPRQDERVMVWDNRLKQWDPQYYNKECDCWDTADGDDYERDLNPQDFWLRLPLKPNNI